MGLQESQPLPKSTHNKTKNQTNEMKTQKDYTTEEGVKKLMASSKTAAEWNANCDKVKSANGGYPAFWYSLIMLSGLAATTQANWK